MEKYKEIIDTIKKDFEVRQTALDDLYIMGKCHAIQSIIINDMSITRKEYTEIYDLTQSIINSIVNI